MRKNPRRILSPQRLPFRHPGIVGNKALSVLQRTELVTNLYLPQPVKRGPLFRWLGVTQVT